MYGLGAGGAYVLSLAVCVLATERQLVFARARLLVFLTNRGAGAPTEATCVPVRALPTQFEGVCGGGGGDAPAVQVLVGGAPAAFCSESAARLISLCAVCADGLPTVLALTHNREVGPQNVTEAWTEGGSRWKALRRSDE
jgi:hypothetical protein